MASLSVFFPLLLLIFLLQLISGIIFKLVNGFIYATGSLQMQYFAIGIFFQCDFPIQPKSTYAQFARVNNIFFLDFNE